MRSLSAVFVALGLVVASLGCSSKSAPLPSVVDAEDFELAIRDFHWEVGGSELLSIPASGEARLIYIRGELEVWPIQNPTPGGPTEQEVRVPHWYEVHWTPTPEQLHELEVFIDEQRILGLDDRYVNEDVDDGWSREYSIRANGRTKRIHCSNEAPRELRRLDDFVEGLRPSDRPVDAREVDKAELSALGLI